MRTSVGERLQAAKDLIFVLLSLIPLFALPPRLAPGAFANKIASKSEIAGIVYVLDQLWAMMQKWSFNEHAALDGRGAGPCHR